MRKKKRKKETSKFHGAPPASLCVMTYRVRMSATTNTSMRARATPAPRKAGPASVSSRTRRSGAVFSATTRGCRLETKRKHLHKTRVGIRRRVNGGANDDSWSLLSEEMNRAAKNSPINEEFSTRRASSGGYAPRPLESIFCKGKSRVELIREIVNVGIRERADVYVVGYPRQTKEELELLERKIREVTESNIQNNENKRIPIRMHRVCEQFAEALAQISVTSERKIPVEMYDESFTSDEAINMKRGSLASDDPKLDSIAAALLLERYFEKTDGEPIRITPPEAPPSSTSWGNRKR